MKRTPNARNEDEIFAELQTLAAEPGYIHAISFLCFRDNAIVFEGKLNADNLANMYSPERLVRTEISTLIGLLVKNDLDLSLPQPNQLQKMIDRSDQLLKELHNAMIAPISKAISNAINQGESISPFSRGDILREAIFYCGESAYDFQFRDFALEKYKTDDDWLKSEKGFSISDAITFAQGISILSRNAIVNFKDSFINKDPLEWTALSVFTFTTDQIMHVTQLDRKVITKILDAFSLPNTDRNQSFNSVSDFNSVNTYPIIRISETEFVIFQYYCLVQAIYESPAYWMSQDEKYVNEAAKNRGSFSEMFCTNRMRSIFGDHHVYKNVTLKENKKITVGEIDVLVLFGNRAIIIQAKSKRLTIEARKGNDNQLQNDFKLAIQDSYNQGLSCAKALQRRDIIILDNEAQQIRTAHPLKEIYIFCVLSEHYPALAFQAHQLLHIERTEQIKPPFVMDIFLLDTMVEMLASPLYFISYINRRTEYDNKVVAAHELTVLSYHLKRNLWIEPKVDSIFLDDDVCADLDIAMMARRNGFIGNTTPDGILTRLRHTKVGELIKQIEDSENSELIDLGLFLLALNEDTVFELSKGIETIVSRASVDLSNHDFSMSFTNDEGTGITIHSNNDPIGIAMKRLYDHCKRRKYFHKAQTWFGLCLKPRTGAIRFNSNFEYPWKQSREMDDIVVNMSNGQKRLSISIKPRKKKAGRNDPCPCGSGRKYKKCCLYRKD